ncbi:hypothetical protein OGATHE_004270 [Ogataea polymorpha]|uniref:Uncharacterized protein n=1 Tax=Ogataea polymorpha TaxID=460523 RepID=A0A9P8P087_9ASCO|nr:hypothetical protein OGATHE_004270 [Ogataea polymorpha]
MSTISTALWVLLKSPNRLNICVRGGRMPILDKNTRIITPIIVMTTFSNARYTRLISGVPLPVEEGNVAMSYCEGGSMARYSSASGKLGRDFLGLLGLRFNGSSRIVEESDAGSLGLVRSIWFCDLSMDLSWTPEMAIPKSSAFANIDGVLQRSLETYFANGADFTREG